MNRTASIIATAAALALGAAAPATASPSASRESVAAVRTGVGIFAEFFYKSANGTRSSVRDCRHEGTAGARCVGRVVSPDTACTFVAHARPQDDTYSYWQTGMKCDGAAHKTSKRRS